MTDLRYPIGPFVFPDPFPAGLRRAAIDALRAAPARLRAAVAGLDDVQLDTPYRPDGWTVRQVVHHLADSHLNAWCRCKLTLTEDHPTIRPYAEKAWAALPDSALPIGGSLALIDQLHARWVALLDATPAEAFSRTCFHPEGQVSLSLDRLVASYAWHGAHHTAHILGLRTREGWRGP